MKRNSERPDQTVWMITMISFALLLLFAAPQRAVAQSNTFPNTGNVGIGTTNPGAPLQIGAINANSVPSNTNLAISSTGSTSSTVFTDRISMAVNNDIGYGPYIGTLWLNWGGDTALVLGTRKGNVDTNALYVTNGNVGIGTASPDARLTVLGSGATLPTVYNFGDTATFVAPTDEFNNISLVKGGVANPQGLHFGVNQASLYSEIQAAHNGVVTDALILNRQGGNVGIGTTTPGYKLDVNGTVNATGLNVNGSPIASSQWTTSGSNINYATAGNVGIGTGTPTYKLHVTGDGRFTGNLTVDGNLAAKYQDVAEWVPSSEQLPAGTVVVLDSTKSNQVIASTVSYDTRVAGVISEQPGIALGERGENKVLVATTGRVRVKVDATTGPIHIGDLLVTSNVPGVAMKSEPVNIGGVRLHRPGTLIGKALEPLAKGSGEILVLLSLQ